MASKYLEIPEVPEEEAADGKSKPVLVPMEIKEEPELTYVIKEERKDTLKLKKELENDVTGGLSLETSDENANNATFTEMIIPIEIKEEQEDISTVTESDFSKENADPLYIKEENVKEAIHDSNVEESALETILYSCHVCLVCDQQFEGLDQLRRHQSAHNRRKKLFGCDVCGKPFLCKSGLIAHKRTHNPETKKRFKCDVCGKRYGSRESLVAHRQTHADRAGKENYKCNVCKRWYIGRDAFQAHQLTHGDATRESFKCEICWKTYLSSKRFLKHKQTHATSAVKKIFKCDLCEKAYLSKAGISVHKHSHEIKVKQRVTCDICEKSYASSRLLFEHKQTHAPLKIVKEHFEPKV